MGQRDKSEKNNFPELFPLFLEYLSKSPVTWCHCRPVKAPPRFYVFLICVEENLHHIAWACQVRWQVGSTIFVQQWCPVAVSDAQKVRTAIKIFVTNIKWDIKGIKTYWQDMFLLYLYYVGLVKVVWVVTRVVRRGDIACDKESFKIS